MAAPHSRAAELFGERVRAARLALGLSQEEAAHLADMHSTHYGRIERGEANAELHTIVRLATALNVDPGDLLRGLYGDELLPKRTRTYTVADFIASRKAEGGR